MELMGVDDVDIVELFFDGQSELFNLVREITEANAHNSKEKLNTITQKLQTLEEKLVEVEVRQTNCDGSVCRGKRNCRANHFHCARTMWQIQQPELWTSLPITPSFGLVALCSGVG